MPFDFASVSTPFRMQPGLRRVARGAEQLTPNRPGDRALREKLAVLFHHSGQALLAEAGFDPQPALRTLTAHATAEHPDALHWDGDAGLTAHHLGWALRGDRLVGHGAPDIADCIRALPPRWRATALLCLAFAEDFAVIDAATGRIPWLAVCLPSHWAPEEKVGRHFTEVHAPVADNRLIITASDHLARLVTGAEAWERFVWNVTPDPRLHAHPDRCGSRDWPLELAADALAGQAFFRTERQTFIPIPGMRQAVFTIHVESEPLEAAVSTPERARQLHDALATMSAAVLDYRGLADARERLLGWLEARALGEPG